VSTGAAAADPLVYFDGLVDGDRQSFRMYLALTAALVAAGIALLAVGILFPASDEAEFAGLQDLAVKLGGLCISSLGTIPLSQCLTRRDRLIAAQGLRAFLAARLQAAGSPEQALAELYGEIARMYQVRMS